MLVMLMMMIIIMMMMIWHKPNSCNSEHDLEHDFWHEGEHQKARSRAWFLARGKAPKSTICGTKESTKKHDIWHEGEHQKARSRVRFFARGKAPKSTILCTKEDTQNNVRPKYKEFLFWLLQLLGRTQKMMKMMMMIKCVHKKRTFFITVPIPKQFQNMSNLLDSPGFLEQSMSKLISQNHSFL